MSNVPVDKIYMRDLMITHKKLLLDLFKNEPNTLSNVNDFQMNTVIRILHLIFNNEIPLLEENFQKLKKSRRLKNLLQHFKKEKHFLQTLQLDSETKRTLLKRFTACYPYLFHSIFINTEDDD